MPSLRIVFAGTPEFAARHLHAILNTSHGTIGVFTQPDRPAGRGKKPQASPVKALAERHAIPVFQPPSLREKSQQQVLESLNPDLLVVVAYGLLLPPEVLAIPRFGCINVHASLLPRWRGAAPIERALLAGDDVTGVTIMQMDAGLDTGAMIRKTSVKIDAKDTRQSLEKKLADAGTVSLIQVLDNLEAAIANAEIQDNDLSTYARKLDKTEAIIDWSQPAATIDRQIRSGIGRNPAYTHLADQRIRILAAEPEQEKCNEIPGTIVNNSAGQLTVACGEGCLKVTHVQLPGKNPVSIPALMNSHALQLSPGKRFISSRDAPP